MAAKFGNLESMRPSGFYIHEIYQLAGITVEGEAELRTPKLRMRFAGEQNPGYWNALVKRTTKGGAARMARQKVDVNILKRNRAHDRELFPKFVVVELIDVPDEDGNPVGEWNEARGCYVDESPENIRGYVNALPGWIFDDVRNSAANPTNYIAEPEDDDGDEFNGEPDESEIEDTAGE